MEYVPCEVCGSKDHVKVSDRDRRGRPLKTVLCKECGLVYTNPRPNPEEMMEYYSNQYRNDYKGVFVPKAKHILRAAKVAKQRISRLKGYLKPGMKVLDVGSGGGEFVWALEQIGIEAIGVEPHKGYGGYARDSLGLNIVIGFIEDMLGESDFDMITMFHVIEHLYSPYNTLLHARTLLKNSGILVIECPNLEFPYQLPKRMFHKAHLYNFSSYTLERLANKAGFELLTSVSNRYERNIFMVFSKAGNSLHPKYSKVSPEKLIEFLSKSNFFPYYLSPYGIKNFVSNMRSFLGEYFSPSLRHEPNKILEHVWAEERGRKGRFLGANLV